ncbi:hypothetical protein HMPREF1990_00300 [Porphyromonas gingivalis W4087]|nr:hypothetical protein HMPREF1554_00072 [Porphyromonas gingivalis F0569]ERJ89064.1 hypothetical protein HMPREF1989_00040 [Porphyromonas gingivalis F0566]ERJ91034.1 hypothetical protein HMPREF1990_00300 [Porphyromonas gingivalis W4087]
MLCSLAGEYSAGTGRHMEGVARLLRGVNKRGYFSVREYRSE